jgi:hypothetical protein
MSTDKGKSENTAKNGANWTALIEHSNQEISACLQRIKKIRKSLKYFKKQIDDGIPFPLHENDQSKDLS